MAPALCCAAHAVANVDVGLCAWPTFMSGRESHPAVLCASYAGWLCSLVCTDASGNPVSSPETTTVLFLAGTRSMLDPVAVQNGK